ncbi:hypothetical protein [Roseiflexus sp.]
MQRNPALIASVCALLVSILFAAGLSLAAPSSAHLLSVQVTLASGGPPAPLDVQVEPGAAVVWRAVPRHVSAHFQAVGASMRPSNPTAG